MTSKSPEKWSTRKRPSKPSASVSRVRASSSGHDARCPSTIRNCASELTSSPTFALSYVDWGSARQADDEARIARLRGQTDSAAVTIDHDPIHDIEPKPGAGAHAFGREEGVENSLLHLQRHARSTVGDFDLDAVLRPRRA